MLQLAMLLAVLVLGGQSANAGGVPFWQHLAQSTDLVTTRGSHLSLMVVDVTGDDKPEIFVAPQTLCGNGGCEWSVYSPIASAGAVRHLGEVLFSESAFLVDRAARRIRYCSHVSAESCSLGEYVFEATAIHHRRLGTCISGEASCENRLREMRTWLAARPPALFDATIAADDALSGLRWLSRRGDTLQSAPDLDHLRVVASR
jgi:hypothetical protein